MVATDRQKRTRLGTHLKRIPWFPLSIIFGMLAVAILASWFAPYNPVHINLKIPLEPPVWVEGGSAEHLLGTDSLGRDVLARLIYGSRYAFIVAGIALLMGAGVGLSLGVIAGYVGKRVDTLISRAIDITLSFPTILIALLLAVSFGSSLLTLVVAISFVLWARFARVLRGETLSIKEQDFITQAKIDNCSTLKIMVRHIMPNLLNTLVVMISLNVGWVIILEATLSFLGAGLPPPTPSWGQMAAEGREYITSAWWLTIFPGIAIGFLVLSFNLFGDWLRDALDPKLRQL